MRLFKIFLIPAILLWACQNSSTPETTYQPLPSEVGPIGDSAMISTAHPLATKVGLEVLRNGGNAFDAALAIKFSLAVVFPRAGNIGGGGFAVWRLNDGAIGSLDFREKAPSSSSRNMYLDENGEVIKDLSIIGHKAAGVPGSVDGILKLHEKYGTKSLAELIQPSIELAYYGYTVTEYMAEELNAKKDDFAKVNGADFFLIKDRPWQTGDTIRFTELAGTLAQIRDRGREGFYSGIVADQIVKEMQRGGGLITKDDLQNYSSKWRDPLVGSYRGHEVISMPPPSSGGVAVIQMLQGAEAYDIKGMGHNTPETIHILSELERRVFADRATYLGDPDYYDVPVDMLLSEDYNKERFSSIQKDKKTDSQEIKQGKVDVIESVETTHLSVVDPEGNAVVLTTTLNSFFGCKVYVKGAGFFLNNEMDDFSSKPGKPNQFGLVGGEANAIVPEKRMLSSMTPTIVVKDGQVKMLVGTPGGATILTSIFQAIMNVIDHEMSMQDAVNATRTHHQWLPDRVIIERRWIDPATARGIQELGHEIEYKEPWGRMDCILRRDDGTFEGGADYTRGDNYAEGF